MSICNRCGFNLAYGKIHQLMYWKNKAEVKKDYESLDEGNEEEIIQYGIETRRGSRFPSHMIDITGNVRSIKELRDKYPWIVEEVEEVEKVEVFHRSYGNLCDECISTMLINKELLNDNQLGLLTPFYTSCCDQLVAEMPFDGKGLYWVDEINFFPYPSYLKMTNSTGSKPYYMVYEDLFFTYYPFCMICKDCLIKNKNRLIADIDFMKKDHPCFFPLRDLKKNSESYIINTGNTWSNYFFNDDNYNPLIPKDHADYYYSSKKNNLLLKRELNIFIAKRNLYLLRKYFPISHDVISCILKCF